MALVDQPGEADRVAGEDDVDDVDVANGRLRSALELAFDIAVEAARRRLPVPDGLRQLLRAGSLAGPSLGRARRAVVAAPEFRSQVGAVAADGGVDELGVMWLTRPRGWVAQVLLLDRLATERELREQAQGEARKERRRREAAETKQARLVSGFGADAGARAKLEAELDAARSATAAAEESLGELRRALAEARTEVRHATDRQRAAERRRDELEALLAQRHDESAGTIGEASAEHSAAEAAGDVDAAEVRRLVARLRGLVDDLGATVERAAGSVAGRRRVPLALPGAVTGNARATAEFLVRADAEVVVDGYNVAKLGWPSLPLTEQRDLLAGLVDNVIRRYASTVTVVFDGAEVVGAHAPAARLARVTFSPPGITADDVVVDLLERLPATRHIVVVTNDAELRRRVRRLGANLLHSEDLLELGLR